MRIYETYRCYETYHIYVISMPLEDLLVDKKDQIENFVEKAKDLVGIDNETGENVILVSRSGLSDRHLIGLHLIGKYFASELQKVDSSTMSLKELAQVTGLSYHTVAARLSDLKREGLVRAPSRGDWEIIFPKIGVFLDEIRDKLNLQ